MARFLPCLVLLFFLAPSAWAWDVELASSTGIPAHWETPLVTYWVLPDAEGLTEESVLAAVRNAADAWEEIPCHLWTASYQGVPTGDSRAIDGENRILFVQENWEGSPAEVALTHVTRDKNTGRLADADITVNDAAYTLTTFPVADPLAIDLEGLLTHEWGHLMGLAHSHAPGATMQALVENDARPLRTLTPDDAEGLCSLYEPRAPEPTPGDETRGLSLPALPGGPSPPPLPWVVLMGLALCVLRSPRTRIHLVAALLASCSHAPAPGEGDATTWVDVSEDADSHDSTADTTMPLQVQALLEATPTWEVTEWHSFDQVTEGDVVIAQLGTGGSRGLQIRFAPGGELQWIRTGAPWGAQRECGVRGSWSAEGDLLTWSRSTSPVHCPGLGAPAVEELRAHVDPTSGELVLTTLSFGWSLGTSGGVMRNQRIHLTPSSEIDTRCGLPNATGECTLVCSTLEAGTPIHQTVALSCAEAFTEVECEMTQAEGEDLAYTCRRGCHEIQCHHRGIDGAPVCEDLATGWTCAEAQAEDTR